MVPLHLATAFGDMDITEYLTNTDIIATCRLSSLLKHYEYIHSTDNMGNTPLHFAAYKVHLNIVRHLIETYGAEDTTLSFSRGVLHLDAKSGNLCLVRYLVERRSEYSIRQIYVNTKDCDKRTPLYLAAEEGKLDVVQYFMNVYYININTKDIFGLTPLRASVQHGHYNVVYIPPYNGMITSSIKEGL